MVTPGFIGLASASKLGSSAQVLGKLARGLSQAMEFVLWVIAVVLVISGIVSIVRGSLLWGIVLIVIGLLVGPGGVSVFT